MTDELNAAVVPAGDSSASNSTAGDAWRLGLSETYRDKYTEFKTMDDVFKGYESLVGKMGKNPLIVPGDKADDKTKAEFQAQLRKINGVPDDVKGYELQFADDLEDGVKSSLQEEALNKYKQIALESGITPKAFNAMVNAFLSDVQGNVKSELESVNAQYQNTVESLKSEWGSNYDKNLKMANAFAAKYYPDLTTPGSETNLKYGNDLQFAKIMYDMAIKSGETALLDGAGAANDKASLPDQAKTMLAEAMKLYKTEGALSPQYQQKYKQAQEMYKRAFAVNG